MRGGVSEVLRTNGTHLGIWISPLGGYGDAKEVRTQAGIDAGLFTDSPDLASPAYYDWWVNACRTFIQSNAVNYFKWDAAGVGVTPHFMALLRSAKELRTYTTNLFLNVTVGTWPSPFWLHTADSVWRGGLDNGHAGVGETRERWITYRDAVTYQEVVGKAPLYPLTALMLGGVIHAKAAPHIGAAGTALRNEVRTYFGSGDALQELYITPSLLDSNAWDQIADAVRWARTHADVLADSHWIGGDPRQLQIYGWAAWTPQKAVLVLRNPSDQPSAISLDPQALFELPPGAPTVYDLTGAYPDQRPSLTALQAGVAVPLLLEPFEVLVFEARPRATFAAQILAANPLAYWRLGESNGPTAFDVLGASPGQYVGVLNHVLPGALIADDDGAVQLNGNGSHVLITNGARFDFTSTNAFTLTTWVKFNQLEGIQRILSNRRTPTAGGHAGYGFGVAGSSNLVFTAFGVGEATASAGPLTTGQWYHVAVVRRGETVEFYRDGVAAGTSPLGGLLASSNPLVLGGNPTADLGEEALRGQLDEVAVFGQALAPAQIQALYAGQIGSRTAPFILTQPASQSRYAGGKATFSITANANPAPSYQWAFNGSAIPGATDSSLALSNLSIAAAGSYSVAVSNVVGMLRSSAATLTVLTPGPYAAAVLADNPVAYWPLDEADGATVFDLWGEHDGTVSGSVTFGVPGFLTNGVGTAAHFDGTSGSQIDVPFAADLNSAAFTVECWARVTGGAGTWRSPLTSRDDPPTAGYLFYAAGNDRWALFTGNSGNGWQELFGPAIVPEQWTHLVGTYDGTTASFYVDGQLAASKIVDFQPNTRRPLRIGAGATETSGLFPFIGDIDEVAVYDRALSLAAVRQHYSARHPTLPVITEPPVSLTRYAGATATFSVGAMSGAVLSYRWQFNGVELAGQTNASLVLTNLAGSAAGTYSVVVSNVMGAVTSAPASLVVRVPGAYAAIVITENPVAYWSLDETNGPTVFDLWGEHDGSASSEVSFGVAGAVTNGIGTAARFNGTIGTQIDVPFAAELNPAAFTVECWARVTGGSNTWRSPLTSRDDPPTAGYSFYATGDNRWELLTGRGSAGWHRFSGPAIVPGKWTQLAATYDGTTASFYVDGQLASAAAISFQPNTQRPLRIGAGSTESSGLFPFVGDVDEVAVYNRVLSLGTLQEHYAARQPAFPIITASPTPLTRYLGATATFTVTALSDNPLSYQWRFNDAELAGQTNASLVLSNLAADASGNYSVVVSNLVGAVTSAPAALVVLTPHAYAATVLADNPVAYWPLDETNGPTVFDQRGQHNGSVSGQVTFGVAGALTNGLGSAAHFDGTAGTQIDVPYAAGLNSTSFTVECWARVTGGSNTWRSPVTSRDDSPSAGYALYASGINRWELFTGKGTNNWQELFGPAIVPDKWTYLVASYDGTTAMLYTNGQLAASTRTTFQPNTRRPLRIGAGATETAGLFPFVGDVDEVAIYDYQLSGSRVRLHYWVSQNGPVDPPVITNQPIAQTRYLGGQVTFSVAASSRAALEYQWQFNGANLAGQTAASLVLTNLPYSAAGSYTVVVGNVAGSVTSAPASLVVLTPTPYVIGTLTNRPVAYWRLDEANGPAVFDAWGNHHGAASGNVVFRVPGALTNDPNTAMHFDGSAGTQIDVPYAEALNPAAFTVECWARVTGGSNTWRSPLTSRDDPPTAGYQFYAGADNRWNFLSGNGTTGWQQLTGPAVVQGKWTYLAATFGNGKISFYVNGQLAASLTTTFRPNTRRPLRIGSGVTEGPGMYAFIGDVDEVAVYNQALNAAAIQQHYSLSPYALPVLPVITNPPVARACYLGGNATFSVGATGTAPLSYLWHWNSNAIWWATSPVLELSRTPYEDAGLLSVVVSNLAGSVTSAPVALTVLTPGPCQAPFLTNSPIAYWRLNESNGPAVFDLWGGHDGLAQGSVLFRQPGAIASDGGTAAYFDGAAGTQVEVPYSADLNPTSFSVLCWTRVTGGANTYRSPVTCRDDSPPRGYLFYASATNRWEFWTGAGASGWRVLAGPNIVPGKWTFLAGTFDGTTQRFYVDGQLVGSLTGAVQINTRRPLRIGSGATESSTGFPFVGDIQDVLLYGRALTAAQVEQHFSAASLPLVLTMERVGSDLRLLWPGGQLEQADSPVGPWISMPESLSPWTVAPTNATGFFRLRLD